MANPTGKDVAVKIDGNGTVLTDITSHLNSASLSAPNSLLEDSALGDEERTYVAGLSGATVSMSGFYNSTVEGLLGPFVGNRTSKAGGTLQYQAYAINSTTERVYRGEVLYSNVQVSGAPDSLETFSADATFTGVVTRTSVGL